MARVGIVASDHEVLVGLERIFARRRGVEIVAVGPSPRGVLPKAATATAGVGASAAAPAGEHPAATGTTARAPAASPELLILDIWPPTADAAEAACAGAHARHPAARIIAVVHRPTPALLARVRRAGAAALWPKERARDLADFALGLLSETPAPAPPTSIYRPPLLPARAPLRQGKAP